MTRLNFRFVPCDAVDFDVCAGPTRPIRTKPETPDAESAASPPPPPEPPPPAKG